MNQLNSLELKCPCCNATRRYGNLDQLRKGNAQHQSTRLLSPVAAAKNGFLHWACDNCIKKKKAIIGRPDQQNVIGTTLPFFAYYDQHLTCSTCKTAFTFTKEEQQYWYEDLKFITWSTPIDCKACRKAKRLPKKQNTKLSDLIKKLEPDNLNQIEDLIHLCLEMHKVEKAKYFFAMGKKHNKEKNSKETKERLQKIKENITNYTSHSPNPND